MTRYWQCKECSVIYATTPPDNGEARRPRRCLVCGHTGEGASPYAFRADPQVQVGDEVLGYEVVRMTHDKFFLRRGDLTLRFSWVEHPDTNGWVAHVLVNETVDLWDTVRGSFGTPHRDWREILAEFTRSERGALAGAGR